MFRLKNYGSLFTLAMLAIACVPLRAADTLEQRVAAAIALLDGAEDRFQTPDPQWFESTQQALSEETQSVGQQLDSHGEAYALAWKSHLRWPLLTSNLGSVDQVELAELALVRRWLYSNREGLEYPFFAQLRQRSDAHLDAVYTFSQPNLERNFRQQVVSVRQQLHDLAAEPNDARAATLGRTLGWFERTQQLPAETAAVRSLFSFTKAQIVISKPLIDRAIALLAIDVEQTLPVSDRVTVQSRGLLSQSRTAHVHGTANTKGQIGLELAANAAFADFKLVYRGEVESRCRALVGPVTVAMQTVGPVRAVTPVQVSLQGVQLVTTEVFPQVETRVTGVTAQRELIRRLGERRVREPESLQQMNSRASSKAATLIQREMDERVATALAEIQAEIRRAQESFDGFQEVLAPIIREGATTSWQGVESTADGVIVNAVGRRREQIGATATCPANVGTADVQARLHVSFFNNMLETIMAGKTFTDTYFMNYGKILQAELPPPLMVHSRSQRWAIVAAKPRPLEISIPAPNQLRIELRVQRVEIAGEQYTGDTVITMNYALVQNEFGEYRLERQGEVQLVAPLSDKERIFLLSKLNAFFAPVLDGGGVALPEGGSLGQLRGLQPQGVFADRDWIALGVNVPTEFLEAWLPVPSE